MLIKRGPFLTEHSEGIQKSVHIKLDTTYFLKIYVTCNSWNFHRGFALLLLWC